MEDIKIMRELMDKSSKILKQFNQKNKLSKEEMIEKAKVKIENYFDEILELCPFEVVNIQIDDQFNVFIRNDSEYLEQDDGFELKASEYNKFIIINDDDYLNQSNYYAVNPNHVNYCWTNYKLKELDHRIIIKIIKNFNIMDHSIKSIIMSRIQKEISKNARELDNKVNEYKILEEFLTDSLPGIRKDY